jgi:hypothetical protein
MSFEDKNVNTITGTLDPKLASAETLLKQAAAYVATAQPQLDKYAEFKDQFGKRAAQVAGVLVDRGVIPATQSDLLLQKFAADPTKALDMIAQLARLVGPDQLGKSAAIRVPQGRALGPFEALVMNGDPANTHNDSSAMVD